MPCRKFAVKQLAKIRSNPEHVATLPGEVKI